MLQADSPLTRLRAQLRSGALTPPQIAQQVIAGANSNKSGNTYIHFDRDALLGRAELIAASDDVSPLFSVPVSLKDCFDLAGSVTTFGSAFYAAQQPPPLQHSAVAQRILDQGALLTGKTNLHPLAYGITGQNPDYGDCLQPRDASLLTGGSSSGAAASVQEGSALVAIGTDTGGSIRVPAALCGLVGFRASRALADTRSWWPDVWRGARHLAPSFDTIGFLLRDPRDAVVIAEHLFDIPLAPAPAIVRIGCIASPFLHDAEPQIMESCQRWKDYLQQSDCELSEFTPASWHDSLEIFAGIQAHEAAEIHRGRYDHFEAAIRDRLRWGTSLSLKDVEALRERCTHFNSTLLQLFQRFDFLMMPCAPVSRLPAGTDLSQSRQIILRYTTPFSLAGLPVISLPTEMIGGPFGTGVQIAAAPLADPQLLAWAYSLGDRIAAAAA